MMTLEELVITVRVERRHVTSWVEAGWLLPESVEGAWTFTEIDVARARLIRDLIEAFEVNDAAVPVILDLIDQRQALEGRMRDLFVALGEEPAAVRRGVLARCLARREG